MKRIDEMITQVGEMIHKAYQEGYDVGYSEGSKIVSNALISATKRAAETPQQKRDRIVEQAKADSKELTLDAQVNLLRPKFVINCEKRTIVCLLERFDLGYIRAKGIAKCAPGDCFNVHIGKAIALRRALGLEVPVEYLSVPQPTEVRVGDKIRLKLKRSLLDGNIETVKGFNFKNNPLTNESPGHVNDEQYDIIDDSREVSE